MAFPRIYDMGVFVAAGVSPSIPLDSGNAVCQIVITNIGSNVQVHLEGSLDNDNWFTADEYKKTFNSNGVHSLFYGDHPTPYIRVNVVSVGSGSPSVAIKLAQE